jgi:hypothetical protein
LTENLSVKAPAHFINSNQKTEYYICEHRFSDVTFVMCRSIDGRLAVVDKLQQRSCEDLGVNYPGDLASVTAVVPPSIMTPRASTTAGTALTSSRAARRAVPPPLVKRNTVADFANTRAYQASTASLISASEQGK